MTHLHSRILPALAVLLLAAGPGRATMLETTVPPAEGEKYKSAAFRLWLPDGVKFVRGIIVRQHGCGRNGIDHADDVQWQALARKWDCALLGSHFVPQKECADWFDPARGSERAFFVALKTFAAQSKHPELADAPWAIWGHSGGALWATHLLNRHPDRVIAVFARSQTLTTIDPKGLAVPVIFNYGEQEKTGRFASVHKNSTTAFSTYRPKGALWAIAVDPKSSHDCRNSRQLAIPFFDAVLARRLPPVPAKPGPVALKPMDPAAGWLGNPETFAVAPVGRYTGDPAKASWLPDESVAKKWQEYCKTGEVKDPTPPPAPTAVKAVAADGVRLTWSAVADLESGIKRFHVYRDGKEIATVGGEPTKANKQGFYQIWNYGDEPEPRPGPTQFFDKDGTKASRYQVTTENHAGLESKKGEAVGPK